MTATDTLSSRMMSRLQQHNPFYLISAACMLFGCLAVTNSLSWMSIPISRLIVLITTLNVYEAALIALAYYLIRHRGNLRDGVMLLVLEAFFLIDVTFLNAEIVTSHPMLGLTINLILFAAAAVKLSVVARLLNHSSRDGRFVAILLQLAVLFAMPVVFRLLDRDSHISPLHFYALWWLIGLMIPLSEAIYWPWPIINSNSWARRTMVVYMTLPFLSLVMHAGILHYVYDITFFGADAAPLLLGLAFVMTRIGPDRFAPRRDLLVMRILFPIAAVAVSLNNPYELWFRPFAHSHMWITPIHIALTGAYLTYVFCFVQAYAIYFLIAGAMAAMTWIFGPTTEQVGNASSRSWDWLGRLVWHIVPQTTMDWGVTAIAAAFGFLGLGAAISFKHRLPPALPMADSPATESTD
jgi:hypothetical protein